MNVESYSIDGIALQNPDRGWIFRGPSKPLSNHSVRRPALQAPGMPGVLPDPDDALVNLEPPVPTLMVQTPREHYQALLSLLMRGRKLSITGYPDIEAPYEFLSNGHDGYGNGDAIVDVTATIHIPGVFWRDATEQTFTEPVTEASQVIDLWSMTGLVTDAVLRVKGPVTDLRITSGASGQAWITYPALTAAQYLRYECATGKAFITTTDTWVGGSAAQGYDADGPGEKFGIFPAFPDPFTGRGQLVVTTATRDTGAQVQVRGKGAYVA